MNTDAKILDSILIHQIQSYKQKTMQHDQGKLSQECRAGSTFRKMYFTTLIKTLSMITSTDAEKAFEVVQQFMIRRLSKAGTGGALLNPGDPKKPTTNTTLNNSDRMLSSTGREHHKGCVLTPLSWNTVLESLGRAMKPEK